MTKRGKEQNQAFYDWWESQKESDGHVHSPKMTYPKVIIDDSSSLGTECICTKDLSNSTFFSPTTISSHAISLITHFPFSF